MAHKTHRDPMANWFLFSAFLGLHSRWALSFQVETKQLNVVPRPLLGWKMEMSSRKNARHSAVFFPGTDNVSDGF
jgi:hypothetical protein